MMGMGRGGPLGGAKSAPTAAMSKLTGMGDKGEGGADLSDRNFDEWSGYGGTLF
jgi:hypothetical protein